MSEVDLAEENKRLKAELAALKARIGDGIPEWEREDEVRRRRAAATEEGGNGEQDQGTEQDQNQDANNGINGGGLGLGTVIYTIGFVSTCAVFISLVGSWVVRFICGKDVSLMQCIAPLKGVEEILLWLGTDKEYIWLYELWIGFMLLNLVAGVIAKIAGW
eukprot:TRINITY_DN607_c1_g1_i6.p1 TRINITY_DN607_c1_g1~~TRINITY_DN607_c1_g1_i6.p1  ORF type:complete len:161 (+),score=31.16 TRINITY_DN607_c1_g1_i6:136-618(+)